MLEVSLPRSPIIALLTDFGLHDSFVGVMKGVILGIAPQTRLIDLTHDIAPQQVTQGAWVLASSYRYFPAGSIFLCVVDPGVGSTRQALALHAGNWLFVGPDNGLFSPILQEQPVHRVVSLTNPHYHLPQVSATFQGRDLFSPVAAHLAAGIPLLDLGSPLDPASLQRLDQPAPQRDGPRIQASIVYRDHFGNLVTNIAASLVPDLFTCHTARLSFSSQPTTTVTERRRFFAADPAQPASSAQPFLYIDSSGFVGIAIQNDNASARLGISTGETVTLVLSGNGQ